MTGPNKMVELSDVTVELSGKTILKDVSLEVKRGEFAAVIGPNGGGKTTLLKTMLGLVKPVKGQVVLFNKPLAEFKDWKSIGYIPQNVSRLVTGFPVSVKELLLSGTGSRRNRQEKVRNALRMVKAEQTGNSSLSSLSGGMLQRVFIALALINNPSLLILDEPATYLDPVSQSAIYKLLGELNKELGITMVITSHDLVAVTKNATKILCVNGNVITAHKVSEILENEELCRLYGFHVYQVRHDHTW